MKNAATTLLLCLVTMKVSSVPITLILSDEVEVSDGKLCVYENAQRSESVKVANSAPCHYTKSFDND